MNIIMGANSTNNYVGNLIQLENSAYKNATDLITSLWGYVKPIFNTELQDSFNEPMPWIGIYIAFASLFCILAMVADLLHGLKNRKLWFPCNYFTLNAASLSVIAVAVKLPMDLTNSMGGNVDEAANLGSMAFMCTMMANFLPSLATMDNKELLTNIIALGVLVITLVVNICIQIKTGVFITITNVTALNSSPCYNRFTQLNGDIYHILFPSGGSFDSYTLIAISYVAMLLVLLIIHTCSALTILRSKQILESKNQAGHERALKDLELQQPGRLNVEKLKQHVSSYWVMAGTSSPQFMAACSATTSASGVICAATTTLHIFTMITMIFTYAERDHYWWDYKSDYNSDYQWSTPVIFITQFIGVVLGTIAPLFRCFASLSFKMSLKWIWEHIKVFKVESYWTQKLNDWKQSSIPFPLRSRKCKVVIENSKFLILSFCIGFQKTVVVVCKMMALIPIFFMVCVLFCFFCWKWLKVKFSASGIVLVTKHHEQLPQNDDISQYVLQLHDDMEPAERTLKRIIKSMNRSIQKAKKQQPKNLIKLLKESRGFEGVEKFDSHHVPPLHADEYLNCWSLPLVTLTAIAISLPNIQNNQVDSLLRSVSEGLAYVTLVEESLDATDEYVRIQKAAKMLWLEVEVYHKWLGNKLKDPSLRAKTAGQILEWFRDKSKNVVTEVEGIDIEGSKDNSFCRSICSNSMYRITQTILLSYQDNHDEVSQKKLFVQLSSMIADILAACLTNLPQVIAMKCHTSVIEKREESVHAAAQLLGETTHIINNLQDRELPSLNPDELLFIDKWHDYLKHPFP